MSPGPSWLIGYDFDIEALNTSVAAIMETGEQAPLLFQQSNNNFGVAPDNMSPNYSAIEAAQQQQRFMKEVVRRSWFTRSSEMENEELSHTAGATGTGTLTPTAGANGYDVDDNFRTRVSQQLKPRTADHPLPSTNYLVSSGHPIYCAQLTSDTESLSSDILYKVQ